MNKAEARRIVKARFSLAECRERSVWDKEIADNVKSLISSGGYKSACIYNALPNEVATRDIIDFAIARKMQVYLPVVRGDDMLLVRVGADTVYATGAYNISEPIGEEIAPSAAMVDIVITPMLAYTDGRGRIGKGKGYYDRFFTQCRMAEKIGLAYCLQYIPDVEMQSHDVAMEKIITEKGIID